jgi:photosystem II stability/assembly factor-like uncharacterized protein
MALAICCMTLSLSSGVWAQAPEPTDAQATAAEPAPADAAATAAADPATDAAATDGAPAGPVPASRAAWQDPATAPSEVLNLEKVQKSMLLDGANARDRAVVVGDRGHVLVSESRSEWRQVQVPTRTMLTAVFALDNNVWAVGHDQVIINSTDGGLTWTRQHADTLSEGPLLDVLFLDAQRGFAVGAYGQFLSTTDGGANWTVQAISDRMGAPAAAAAPAAADASGAVDDAGLASTDVGEDEGDPHLNGIVSNDAGMLIVGEAGSVYRSTDQGASWESADVPYEGSMFGAVALDNGQVIAYGLRGNAFVTADLGRTWTKLETGTQASLLGGAAVTGGRAVLVGASGTVLTAPAGSTQLVQLSFPEGGVMSGVLPLGDTEFLVMGENGIATYQPKN